MGKYSDVTELVKKAQAEYVNTKKELSKIHNAIRKELKQQTSDYFKVDIRSTPGYKHPRAPLLPGELLFIIRPLSSYSLRTPSDCNAQDNCLVNFLAWLPNNGYTVRDHYTDYDASLPIPTWPTVRRHWYRLELLVHCSK